MDSPTERMPIACVHCAKAKAKCDKKVPCSRCVGKQIVCHARATRRSSHNPNRRNGMARPHPERALTTSTGTFHVSQLSQFSAPTPDVPMMSPNHHVSPQHIPPVPPIPSPYATRTMSMPDVHHPHMHIAPVPYNPPEMDHQTIRSGFTQTPPDLTIPITPMISNMPQMDGFIHVGQDGFDPNVNAPFLNMNDAQGLMDFDAANMLDFNSPPSMFADQNDHFLGGQGKFMQTPNQMQLPLHDPSTNIKSGLLENGSPPFQDLHVPRQRPGPPGLSPSTISSSGLQEPDAVVAAHQSWPFFQCNRVEPSSTLNPPKTAHIYLEGLSQTLRNQSTWQAWKGQINEKTLDIATERQILTEPIVGYSREKLLAITQTFLHKALDIHKNDRSAREESPSSPDSSRDAFLMLPPPDVMQYFLRSYAVRYEPYYSSVPAGQLDPNALMQSANSKAASLLILLMVASGASTTATAEARYIASGLTEACRISLFDLIEKDVMLSRDPLVLRSALLFICQAAWSGDKWHMDMAMGQRGTYLAMLSHAGLLDKSEIQFGIDEVKRDPNSAWEEWKQHEAKHRLAHAWITVDQEISLFSDTTPLLSIVNLLTPMPDSDDLWHVGSTADWLHLFEKTHGPSYKSAASMRDFFTSFVDGEFAGKTLSPTQLRLLLHPLQAQVCHHRQFISCLPDGGKASRGVSKAATKARLEEISSLLQQWYTIIKQSFSGNKGTCWTTCANLIMYHLISLNAISSFKDIEQFARKEVVIGPFRHASWLQMRCIDAPEEVYFHCGQILRLIRSMPKPIRPPWWAGAVYRVALTAWASSMSKSSSNNRFGPGMGNSPTNVEVDHPFPIDNLTPENEAISRYIKYQEGTPMLTRVDNTMVPLDVPINVLHHCIEVLEDDSSMRLADGIKRKLQVFLASWRDS